MYLKSFLSKAGIVTLILLALLSNIYNSCKMLRTFPDFLKIDSVTADELRFLPLKEYLSNTREVGYITYTDNNKIFSLIETRLKDEKTANKAIDIMAQLVLTQYALSPVFVYNQTDLPLVVGNFPDRLPDREFFTKKHLIPVKTFPKGIILLRNEAR